MITVRLFGPVAQAVGEKTLTLDASTVDAVIAAVASAGAAGLLESCRFALNGQAVKDTSTPISDGDEVAVLPPVGGGA